MEQIIDNATENLSAESTALIELNLSELALVGCGNGIMLFI